MVFDNAPDTIAWLEGNINTLQLMSLDHDLGPNREKDGEVFDPGSGSDVANYLANQKPSCHIILHTTNYRARDKMKYTLEDAGWSTLCVIPYDDIKWISESWIEEVKKQLGK